MKRRAACALCAMLAAIFLLPLRAGAEGAMNEITVLTRTAEEQNPVPGVKLAVYQVASVDAATSAVALTDEFAGAGVSAAELAQAGADVPSRLDGFAARTFPEAAASAVSDEAGRTVFSGLADGIYLIRQENVADDFGNTTVTMESFLVCVPAYDESGGLTRRNVECKPKLEIVTEPETRSLRVYKYWEDNNNSAKKRPTSLEIKLLGDGELAETVSLSAENNWTYLWENLDPQREWTVEEGKMPSGYAGKTAWVDESTVTFTNTYTPPEKPNGPSTGDHSNLPLWISLCALSGLAFLLCLCLPRRGKQDAK